MPDLPVVRRMRRFRGGTSGSEYDETVDGRLRRRLKGDDPSPIPLPQPWDVVKRKEGTLTEIDPVALRRQANKGQTWRRGCGDCGKTSCSGGCTPRRRKGQRR